MKKNNKNTGSSLYVKIIAAVMVIAIVLAFVVVGLVSIIQQVFPK